MIGSGDTVSCGAETVVGENTFYSLVNKMKTPSTWFLLGRGCAWWLHRPWLWRQIWNKKRAVARTAVSQDVWVHFVCSYRLRLV